jgi:oligopeptide transport system substrate-binding protein
MYEADDLDTKGLGNLEFLELNSARHRQAGEYITGPFLITRFVTFDANRPPFDDVRVRRTFALATDRETLAEVILRGYNFPATGGLVPPGMPGHSAGIGLPYDPEGARLLLAEAGYPGGRGFPVVDLLAFQGYEPWTEYLQAQWQENLGVDVTRETLDFETLNDRLRKSFPYARCGGFLANYPDPHNFLQPDWLRNLAEWRIKAYDRLVEKAKRVTDQGERMRLYGQADRMLIEEAAIVPLTYARMHRLIKPWVRKYPISPICWWFWKDVIIEPH